MTIPLSPADFALDPAADADEPFLHVVLVYPEIPPNTGSIARLAAATNTWLHLVEPLGYELDDRHLKRAGLDYWPAVRLSVHESLSALTAMLPWERTWLFSKKATQVYTDATYPRGSVLVFGQESLGLPQDFLDTYYERTVRIPTTRDVRSLNLAQCAALGVYEVVRQHGLYRD